MPMKILVTGAAGFIGMHVAQLLLRRGDEVIGVDNLNDYYDPQLKRDRLARLTTEKGFRFVRADVADRAGMERLFADERFDRVVHLAAQAGVRYSLENPHAYIDSNVVGFMNVLEGCRRNGGSAPGLRVEFQRLRRQHAHAVLESTTTSIIRSACMPPPRRRTS